MVNLLRWVFTSRTDALSEDVGAMMKAAVARMAVLQGSLLMSGFVPSFFEAPQVVVLLLMVLKFSFDLFVLRRH